MRLVIFDELPDDRSRSLGVFLHDFTAHLRSANVAFKIVRPQWRIRGVRSEWHHLVASSILRQFAYPLWAGPAKVFSRRNQFRSERRTCSTALVASRPMSHRPVLSWR